ncbi:MAG TPA: hypothetical protein VM639_00800 [Dongiaceae bacterium]|nr:hypothetical protein [Dongiaceae bacterium]
MADFLPFIPNTVALPDSGYGPAPTLTEMFSQGVERGLENTSIGLFNRSSPYLGTKLGTALTQDQFNEAGYGDMGLSYQPGMTEEALLSTLAARRDRSMENQLLASRTTGGYLAYLGGNVVGGLPDPLNLIGVGEAAEATSLGRAILRGVVANSVITAPNIIGGAALDRAQGMPQTGREIARSFALQATIGGLLGAAGHGLGRLGERARGLDIGLDVDHEGNVIPSNPEPYTPPPDNPAQPLPQIEDQGGKAPKVLTDEQFRNQFVNPESPRPSQVITDRAGNRVVIDPETGEILRDTNFAKPEVQVSEANMALGAKLQEEIKGVQYQAEAPTGVKLPAASPDSAGSVGIRQAIVEQALKAQADSRAEGPRMPEAATPPGVLQARTSPGHAGEIKEVPLREFYQKSLRGRTIMEADVKRFRTGNIRAEPFLQKLRQLTHDQWNYTVDWIAQTPMLRYLARDRGIDFAPDASKREIGDLLWSYMHEGTQERPTFTYKSYPEQYQVPEGIDLNADEIAARIKASDALDGYTRTDDIADIQEGLHEVTPESLKNDLQRFREILGLDELAQQSPEVQNILREAQTLANKKQALIDSILCLLEAE